MKRLLIVTILFVLSVTIVFAQQPTIEAPPSAQVGETFIIRLKHSGGGAEDTVFWGQGYNQNRVEFVDGAKFRYIEGLTTPATFFDAEGWTWVKVRALKTGQSDIWPSWVQWDEECQCNMTQLAVIPVQIDPAPIYLPLVMK